MKDPDRMRVYLHALLLRHITQLRDRSGLCSCLSLSLGLSLSRSHLPRRGRLSRRLRRLQLRQMLHLRLKTQVAAVSHSDHWHT